MELENKEREILKSNAGDNGGAESRQEKREL